MISGALRYLAALALCLSLGLHWGALQSIAWASMLIERIQCEPLGSALRTTFDGQHPCQICHLVKEGRAAEKSQPLSLTKVPRLDLWLYREGATLVLPPEPLPVSAEPSNTYPLRTERPSLPPPRLS